MKNILSVDGGGIRSYIPLRMLNYIENKIYNKKLNEEELVFQYTNMINVIKNYPDMSLNNILLLSIITKIF